MQECIKLALVAKGHGDFPVGSIVVKDGKIIGSGFEASRAHSDITFHAEIESIRAATRYLGSQDLSQCCLYTTHEPCIMCSYVVRHTGINTVVIGLMTGESGGFSSQLPVLIDTTIKKWGKPPVLITGILESECIGLLLDLS